MNEQQDERKKRKGIIWIIIGLLLLLGAAGLTAFNLDTDRKGGEESSAALDKLAVSLEEARLHTVSSKTQLEFEHFEAASPDSDEAVEPEVVEYESHHYIGLITLPTLGLQLPVQQEWSYPNLKISPCRMKGSPLTGDLVILAHNYRSHFGRLSELNIGDEVSVTMTDGTTYVYYVDAIEIVEPTAVRDVTSGAWPLTLFTCTPGGRTRVVVRCDMAED